MHFLDLPNLRASPSLDELNCALDALEPSETTGFDLADPLDKNIRQWLSRLALSPLDWAGGGNEADLAAERVRARASRRLALECGAAALGGRTRVLSLPPLPDVRLYEPGMTGDNLGVLTWGASLVLARHIVAESSHFARRRVIELGAGTGLCGIVAAKVGASAEVTDLPDIVPNLARNVLLNNVTARAYVLDWAQPEAAADLHRDGSYDLAVVSDPLYSREHPELLLTALKAVAAPGLYMEIPLRELFVAERSALYVGLVALGYTRREYVEEDSKDLFGNAQRFAFSRWTK